MKKAAIFACVAALIVGCVLVFSGCDSSPVTASTMVDNQKTIGIGDTLSAKQPTPTDIGYSLERYNLIRRAYWVNGMRDRARMLPCPIADLPLGYIVVYDNGVVIGKHVVEGKVSSLNSYLTPDSEFYEQEIFSSGASRGDGNRWLPDVDGSFGQNDEGIFFFTPEKNYFEYKCTSYRYSDVPFPEMDTALNVNIKGADENG